MSVLVFASDERLIDLHDTHQFTEILLHQRRADAVRHIKSGLVRAEPHDPLDLKARNALLAGEDQIDDLEPLPQSDLGILKNGLDQDREAVCAALPTVRALPMKRTIGQRIGPLGLATWAMDAVRPAAIREIRLAGVIRGEKPLPFRDRHLASELWLGHFRDSVLNGEEYGTP
jgi:hypothetical protein